MLVLNQYCSKTPSKSFFDSIDPKRSSCCPDSPNDGLEISSARRARQPNRADHECHLPCPYGSWNRARCGNPIEFIPRGLVLPFRRLGAWSSVHVGSFVSRRARRPQTRIPHSNDARYPLRRCPCDLLVPMRASSVLFALRECEPGIVRSRHRGPRPENARFRYGNMDADASSNSSFSLALARWIRIDVRDAKQSAGISKNS